MFFQFFCGIFDHFDNDRPSTKKKTYEKKEKKAKAAIARPFDKMDKERKSQQDTKQKRAQTQAILR